MNRAPTKLTDASTRILRDGEVEHLRKSGGAQAPVPEPVVEAVMIGAVGATSYLFVRASGKVETALPKKACPGLDPGSCGSRRK
jgi:hypothetical protein